MFKRQVECLLIGQVLEGKNLVHLGTQFMHTNCLLFKDVICVNDNSVELVEGFLWCMRQDFNNKVFRYSLASSTYLFICLFEKGFHSAVQAHFVP